MRYLGVVFLAWLLGLQTASATDDGLISIPSKYSVAETADRLESILQEKGMTVFIRIDHAAGAKQIGMELRDTELVIFGNPKIGSVLMQCQQQVGIDLPQKALIWKDADAKVWLSYNTPDYLVARHGIEGCAEALTKVSGALAKFAAAATQ